MSQTPRPTPPLVPSAYYDEGAAWAHQVLDSLRRSRRSAWWIAAGAVIVALANGAALLMLSPLRTPLPYLVSVTTQRDDALTLRGLQAGALQSDPGVVEADLARYVVAREEFDATRLRRDFLLISRLSDPAMQRDYAQSFATTSATSPVHLYTPKAVLTVRISSVSLLSSTTALVRFETRRTDLQGSQPEASAADVTFGHTLAPMANVDRYDNPLGFQVTAYQKRSA